MSANYRAACRARSHAEFVSKIGQVEDADESLGWLEFIVASELMKADQIEWELKEADELTGIFAASHRTAKERLEQQRRRRISRRRRQ
jgi:four helix bundle protein